MGNQQSNDPDADNNRRPFRGPGGGGALGLSRSELDKRCQPSGLYDSCAWEERAIRRLIGDGKAAARLKGSDVRTVDANHECPICFLYYEEVNTTKCCSANICTECFLQVRPQKEKHSCCPFCNHPKLSISVAKKLTDYEIQVRDNEEKRVEEARIRARAQSLGEERESGLGGVDGQRDRSNSEGFGASLEQDARVALFRARSESFASSDSNSGAEANLIKSIAMTPEERQRLEAEMRNQNMHPLALQVEAEAQQRILQNERAYTRSQSDRRGFRSSDLYGRSSRRRGRGALSDGTSMNLSHMIEAMQRGGPGALRSLDDLVVLEAAIVLSMEEESRRARNGDSSGDSGGSSDSLDAAGDSGGASLLRSFLANRGRDDETATQQQVQQLARTLSSNRRRNQLLRSGHTSFSTRANAGIDTAMGTAAMLMRGISEEDQMAMAIAESLRDQGGDVANVQNNDTTEVVENAAESGDAATSSDDSGLEQDVQSRTTGDESSVPEEEQDTTDSPIDQHIDADDAEPPCLMENGHGESNDFDESPVERQE